jgi:hypothetical protein
MIKSGELEYDDIRGLESCEHENYARILKEGVQAKRRTAEINKRTTNLERTTRSEVRLGVEKMKEIVRTLACKAYVLDPSST